MCEKGIVYESVCSFLNRFGGDIFTEKKIFPYVKIEDLRLDLLPRLRTMAANNNTQVHPWSSLSDEELLKSMRLYSMDRVTGTSR